MTWIKVCGLRRPDHVELAQEAGADAIGLVLAPASPRLIDTATARILVESAAVDTYLVLVDANPQWAVDMARSVGAAGIQPHGADGAIAAERAIAAGLKVLRPIAVRDRIDLSDIPAEQVPILDTADPDVHGGTGRRWDLSLMRQTDRRWVLAGGLTPENVGEVIRQAGPWGIDASSGLESSPGEKDPGRIRAFIEEARAS